MTSRDHEAFEDDEPSYEVPEHELDEAPALASIARALVQVALREFEGRQRDEVLPEELSELQREVVRLVAAERLSAPLEAFGLGHANGLPRLLGDVEPGPLDMRVAISSAGRRRCWPVWRWLRSLGRGEVEPEALHVAMGEQLSATRVFAICLDVVSGAYRAPRSALLLRDDQAGFLIALIEPHRRALHGLIEEHASLLASLPRRDKLRARAMEHALVLVPLARAAREAGEALDARYDDVLVNAVMHLDTTLGREVLSALPLPRREPRVLGVSPNRYFSSMYMTLCPTPAVAAHTVRQIVGGGRHLPTDRAVEALTALGEIALGPLEDALRDERVEHRATLERAREAIRRAP